LTSIGIRNLQFGCRFIFENPQKKAEPQSFKPIFEINYQCPHMTSSNK